MFQFREGSGSKILLVHGLGGTWRSWSRVLHDLSDKREVIAIDLPGHGETPAEADSGTFLGLTNSVERFIEAEGLTGIDIVGSSMSARMALELARRGKVGACIALDPGGFWHGWEGNYFDATLLASGVLLRGLKPVLPAMGRNSFLRSLLLVQLVARPWALPPGFAAQELMSFAKTETYFKLVGDLYRGPLQTGPSAPGTGPVVIGWGRKDHLCLPAQAARALEQFPEATLHWFDRSGHFPMWDEPEETVKLILGNTNGLDSRS